MWGKTRENPNKAKNSYKTLQSFDFRWGKPGQNRGNPNNAKNQYKTPLSFDWRWGKPEKTQLIPKINIKQHRIKNSVGKTGENPENCFDLM